MIQTITLRLFAFTIGPCPGSIEFIEDWLQSVWWRFILHNISNILGCTCSFISYKEPNPTQPWNLASEVDNICHSTRAVMGTFLEKSSSVLTCSILNGIKCFEFGDHKLEPLHWHHCSFETWFISVFLLVPLSQDAAGSFFLFSSCNSGVCTVIYFGNKRTSSMCIFILQINYK